MAINSHVYLATYLVFGKAIIGNTAHKQSAFVGESKHKGIKPSTCSPPYYLFFSLLPVHPIIQSNILLFLSQLQMQLNNVIIQIRQLKLSLIQSMKWPSCVPCFSLKLKMISWQKLISAHCWSDLRVSLCLVAVFTAWSYTHWTHKCGNEAEQNNTLISQILGWFQPPKCLLGAPATSYVSIWVHFRKESSVTHLVGHVGVTQQITTISVSMPQNWHPPTALRSSGCPERGH